MIIFFLIKIVNFLTFLYLLPKRYIAYTFGNWQKVYANTLPDNHLLPIPFAIGKRSFQTYFGIPFANPLPNINILYIFIIIQKCLAKGMCFKELF